MTIEYHGTVHKVAMDTKTIESIAHSLVTTGKQELAFQFLTNSIHNAEAARAFIQDVVNVIIQARQAEALVAAKAQQEQLAVAAQAQAENQAQPVQEDDGATTNSSL